jgi:hypothetical protein
MPASSNIHFHNAEAFLAHGLTPLTPLDNTEGCSICQQSWTDRSAGAVTTPCNHDFHSDCLALWITIGRGKRTACPLCRRNFFTEPSVYSDDQTNAAAEEQDDDSDYEEDIDVQYDEPIRVARLSRETAATVYIHAHQDSVVEFVRNLWDARGRRRLPGESWGRLIATTLYAHRHMTNDHRMRAACRYAEFEASFIVIDAFLAWGDLTTEDRTGLEALLDRIESAFSTKKMLDSGRW